MSFCELCLMWLLERRTEYSKEIEMNQKQPTWNHVVLIVWIPLIAWAIVLFVL